MQDYDDILYKSGVKIITLAMSGCVYFNNEALGIVTNTLLNKLEVFKLDASKY